jgi:8-oxo-dGTP diphosphatase
MQPSVEESYDPSAYPPFAVTVDLVVLTVGDHGLSVLAVRRGGAPYAGRWALPGGFVKPDEGLGEAAVRELAEETGLGLEVAGEHEAGGHRSWEARTELDGPAGEPAAGDADYPIHLEQLASYGAPDRDPRMRVVSVAYLALAPLTFLAGGGGGGGSTGMREGGGRGGLAIPRAGGDAVSAAWLPVDDLLGSVDLAFDHERILADGVERARSKIEYSSLAAAFCPPEFTVGELRRVYEAVWGVPLDPRNFHRKVTGTPGFLVPTGGSTSRQGGRPAQLFRRGTATLLNPPMLRPTAD